MAEVDLNLLGRRVEEMSDRQRAVEAELALMRSDISAVARAVNRLVELVAGLADEVHLMRVELREPAR